MQCCSWCTVALWYLLPSSPVSSSPLSDKQVRALSVSKSYMVCISYTFNSDNIASIWYNFIIMNVDRGYKYIFEILIYLYSSKNRVQAERHLGLFFIYGCLFECTYVDIVNKFIFFINEQKY